MRSMHQKKNESLYAVQRMLMKYHEKWMFAHGKLNEPFKIHLLKKRYKYFDQKLSFQENYNARISENRTENSKNDRRK